MTERQIETAFVKWAQSAGLDALKLRIDGRNGFPDRTVFTWKGPVFFEFKTKEGRLRTMQVIWKRRLERLGYSVFTPRSFEEAKAQLVEFIKR